MATNKTTRTVRRKEGAIARVLLGDGFGSALAVVLAEPSVAIFDDRGHEGDDLAWLRNEEPMFIVSVSNYAITRGRWPIVDRGPMDTSRFPILPKFVQDRSWPDDIQIYEKGCFRRATRAEAQGLERLAVWDPEHVEDRVRDAYAGRENKWVLSMKLL